MFTEQLSHLGQGVHCGEEWVSGVAGKPPPPYSPLYTKVSFLGTQVGLALGQMKVGG